MEDEFMDKNNRKKFNKAFKNLVFRPNMKNLEHMQLTLAELKADGEIDQECYDKQMTRLDKVYGRLARKQKKDESLMR